jgi:hypothetical protein
VLPKWLWVKDVRGDWFTITCCGFTYTRYASGKTEFQLSQWFKWLLVAAVAGSALATISLAMEYAGRTACEEHGLMVNKEVKYSARAGCYVRIGQEYRRVYFD